MRTWCAVLVVLSIAVGVAVVRFAGPAPAPVEVGDGLALGAADEGVSRAARRRLPEAERVSLRDARDRLLANLDEEFPGRGLVDYGADEVGDAAKSYAMILKAEIRRLRVDGATELSPRGTNALRWIVRSADLDGDGVIGWGVPVAWDAYGDGSTNPPNHEYTISTAIVVDALLDLCDAAPSTREVVLPLIEQSLDPYLDGEAISPSGMPSYSLAEADHRYDCFNPAAYLAGQLQRFANVTLDVERAEQARRLADATIEVLLREHRTTENGHWYWQYSIQEAVPNDLPHACYIVDGILRYAEHGGRLADRFDVPAVLAHLGDFRGESDWRAWPRFREDVGPDPPRLYDLGMALALATDEPALEAEAESLAAFLLRYRRHDGFFRFRPSDARVINEYQAYALLGMTAHLAETPESPRPLEVAGDVWTAEHVNVTDGPQRVPFVRFDSGRGSFEMLLDTDGPTATLQDVDTGRGWTLPTSNLPLSVTAVEGGYVVVTRDFPSSRLGILRVGPPGTKRAADPIAIPERWGDHQFRHAVQLREELLIVLYDPAEGRNEFARLQQRGGTWRFATEATPITFKAALGYEHQPHILSVTVGDTVYLAAGPSTHVVRFVDGELRIDSTYRERETERILELATDGTAVWGLYHDSDRRHARYARSEPEGKPARYALVDLVAGESRELEPGSSMPFDLRVVDGEPRVSRATTPGDLARLFRRDVQSCAASGAMCLGTNNLEGDVIWSQSYYLTGFVDLLEETADIDDPAWRELRDDVAERLHIEMALLDRVLGSEYGLGCRQFATDRQPVVHAVQSGKLLLLLKRYAIVPDAPPLASFASFQRECRQLDGHIEVFAKAEAGQGLPIGRRYLAWPKGCAFPYDGTGIPYNHQNCWAAGMLYRSELTPLSDDETLVATDVAELVLDLEGFRDEPPRQAQRPEDCHWLYWYGPAKTGWSPEDGISVNTPDWYGDGANVALARYRTFDAIAICCLAARFPGLVEGDVLDHLARGVENEGLEPFLVPYLRRVGRDPRIDWSTASYHLRVDRQTDWRNAVWAYAHALRRGTPAAAADRESRRD